MFRKEVLRNQRRKLQGEVVFSQPIVLRILAYLVTLLLMLLILASFFIKIERKETVVGTIYPQGGLIDVKAERSGTVSKVHVSEKDFIKRNDRIIEFISTHETVDGNKDTINFDLLQKSLFSIDEQIKSLKVSSRKRSQQLERILLHISDEVTSLHEQLELAKKSADLANSRYTKFKRLRASGVVFEGEFISIEQEQIQSLMNVQVLIEQHLSRQREYERTKLELTELEINGNQMLDQLNERKRTTLREISSLNANREFVKLSPVSGTISGMLIKAGDQVNANDTISHVIPDGKPLQAIVEIPSDFIGFINVDQEVNIKVDAFPYQKFGSIKGRIVEKTDVPIVFPNRSNNQSNSIKFRIIVSLERDYIKTDGEKFELLSGMTIVAEVILDQRTIIEWLFEPILKFQN